jgi:glycine betaine/proline transport system substrate-binding protein
MKSMTKKASLGLAFLLGANVAMAECGDVQIAAMNWASAQLMANVDKIILEEGYGCNVALVPGDTMPTFTSLNEKGEPDVAPELWINAVREPLKVALEEGRLRSANDGPITGLGEGWWVPPYVVENHPDLKTVLDVLERPDLFPDAEDPSKGAFVGCPAGWGCQLTNANLFRGFKMEEKGWKLVDPGSAAGLDGSMSKAVNRGENWFGYYWSPTALIGRHKLVKLDFGVPFIGSEHWDGCIVKPEQECADPKPSSWTHSEVHTVVTDDFAKSAGADVMDYLRNRVFPGDVMNGMLVYMDENQADGADAAAEFLRVHGDVWKPWLPSEVAARVKGM